MLTSLSCLTHLSLRGCQQLTDSALPHLVALSALRHLNLTACERMAGQLLHFWEVIKYTNFCHMMMRALKLPVHGVMWLRYIV